MARAWIAGRLVAARSGEGGVYARWFSAKQRLHLAALLICLAALPAAAQDFHFDLQLSQQEFAQFSRLFAQGIYATPVEPAGARGLLRFDIGAAVTAVPIDTGADYWQHAVGDDFSVSDHLPVPRLVVSKGLSLVTVAGSYAKIPDTDVVIWGGSLDVPVINGGLVKPTLAIRAAYAQLDGVENFDLNTYGAELFLSKGFGPFTPYAAVGRMRSDATGRLEGPVTGIPATAFRDEADFNRYTVGVRLSLLVPKIVIEATQAEERSYSAKISFGL